MSNKKAAHIKAALFGDLSLLLKYVITEMVGILIFFESPCSCDKSTTEFKTFWGVVYLHMVASGICSVHLILFGNEGKNGQW